MRPLDDDPATLRLAITQARLAPWLRSGVLLRLEALVHALSGETCALALVPVDEDPPSDTDPTQTLERFVAGPSSEACLQAVGAVITEAPARTAPLFISGPAASGKTHLLRATATRLAEKELEGRVLYRSAEALSLEIASAIYGGYLEELRQTLSTYRALLIDDLQTLARREATQRELGLVLATLSQHGAPVVVTADRPLAQLPELGRTLQLALDATDSVALAAPEWETRVAIFLDRALGWGVQLGTNVAAALASGIGDGLHRLDVVLTRAMVLRRSEEESVDLEHARRTLAPGPLYGRPPSPEVVLDVVARRFGVRVRDIRARDRTTSRTTARQIAAYLLRNRCGLSFPEIGRKLDRHYTTALNAVQRSEARLGKEASFASLVGVIEKEVTLRTERGK
jgi:chromosomal replication initiator protein